ncbi:MAG: tetratricopeptide repeat protein [Acidobacteriaceae bacterium]|nr:tetratricopeptide repeat protein [Acidobacteriaceae bacterium]
MPNGYTNLGAAYQALGRVDEAKAILNQGLHRNPAVWYLHFSLAQIAWVNGNQQEMDHELTFVKASGIEGEESVAHGLAAIASYYGQTRKARELFAQDAGITSQMKAQEITANVIMHQASAEAAYGDFARAVPDAEKALNTAKNSNTVIGTALVLALAGQDTRALRMMKEYAESRPDDTLVQGLAVPQVGAVVELKRHNAARAIELLAPTTQYEAGIIGAVAVHGTALLEAGRFDDAIQELQRVVNLKYYAPADPVLPYSKVEMARAYARKGDTAKVRSLYQDVLALWKDADPDVPLIKQAKAEYANLQ